MPANEPAPPKKLTKKAPPNRRDKRRAVLVRFLLTTLVTATMITTGGFGTFPPNELTSSAASLISENFPAEIIEPVNLVLEQAAAPTLEVVERFQSPSAGSEIAKMFENLLDPVFAPARPADSTGAIPAAEPGQAQPTAFENASPTVDAAWTQTAEAATVTLLASATGTQATLTPPLTGTLQPSQTLEPSSTATLLPTPVVIYFPPSPTSTKKPPVDTATPISTPTPTGTTTLTPTPTFGPQLIITNVSLNGGGSSVSVAPGSTVSVTYDFQVMSDGCPGCITQLVTGLGTPGSHGGACAFDGIAGAFPGATGSENTTLTVPTAPGTYTVSVLYSWQYGCADALAGYGPGGDVIGQITVSCTAGLNLVRSAPLMAQWDGDWDGANWTFYGLVAAPNTCVISIVNNSAFDLPVAFKFGDGTCTRFTLLSTSSAAMTGNDLTGQCPLDLYAP